MIESFVFSEGRPVSHNLEMEALRLARADKGLILWIDLTNPTPEETKSILEILFEFHPLAIEDCVTLSELPKIEDYEDYLFMIVHSVDITAEKTLKISELNLFMGKEFLVTYHREPIPGISVLKDRLVKGTGQQARGADRLTHQILDVIQDTLNPLGVGVVVEAQHLCMMMRGVQKQNSSTTTSAFSGQFMKNETRSEFLKLIAADLS